VDAKLPPGTGIDALLARAQAAGVISAAEAATVIAARDLAAVVIRVDDFAQDLGASAMTTAPSVAQVTSTTTVMHKAAA
jgi:hypothetical protein